VSGDDVFEFTLNLNGHNVTVDVRRPSVGPIRVEIDDGDLWVERDNWGQVRAMFDRWEADSDLVRKDCNVNPMPMPYHESIEELGHENPDDPPHGEVE
jgi:hypothetical protein